MTSIPRGTKERPAVAGGRFGPFSLDRNLTIHRPHDWLRTGLRLGRTGRDAVRPSLAHHSPGPANRTGGEADGPKGEGLGRARISLRAIRDFDPPWDYQQEGPQRGPVGSPTGNRTPVYAVRGRRPDR